MFILIKVKHLFIEWPIRIKLYLFPLCNKTHFKFCLELQISKGKLLVLHSNTHICRRQPGILCQNTISFYAISYHIIPYHIILVSGAVTLDRSEKVGKYWNWKMLSKIKLFMCSSSIGIVLA